MLVVSLRSGTLRITVDRAELPLHALCGFGSRRSRKRGFVFVSKVLGKHYPVRPRAMADVHLRLAKKLSLPGPALFIAMAETATCLGQGIYEAWLRMHARNDALFQHTTRYRLNRPLALHFEESHSHATQHFLYRPTDHAALFEQARSLVLVDDEISTGRTLVNLARAYREANNHLAEVHFVCLTDWLDDARRQEIAKLIGLPTRFHSLLQGSFTFTEAPSFDPGPIPDVTGGGDFKDAYLRRNHGRLGVRGPLSLDLDSMTAGIQGAGRVLVLGTGEFAYPPFLLARRLEERGDDVFYQSTTRSPLLIDKDLTSGLEFIDNYHDAIPNYVYNVADRVYDEVLLCYETEPLPPDHRLPEMVKGKVLYM